MHFNRSEFVYSQTAQINKINNQPTPEILSSIDDLIDFLEPFRVEWGKPIIITSGYRCRALNDLVGGSPTSNHLYLDGSAACDMWTPNIERFYYWFTKELTARNLKYDECFLENKKWIHFALFGKQKIQRMKSGLLSS